MTREAPRGARLREHSVLLALGCTVALLLGGCGGSGHKQPPVAAATLPTVTVADVGPGIFDVVLKPAEAGGEPLRGLQVALSFDAAAFSVDKVEAGTAAGRMDTVYDDHARPTPTPGQLIAGVTDLRQVALPLSGSALRVRYTPKQPGQVVVTVKSALGARKGGATLKLPTQEATIGIR